MKCAENKIMFGKHDETKLFLQESYDVIKCIEKMYRNS